MQIIQQGLSSPQRLITQGFQQGAAPAPPVASIFTQGFGSGQKVVTQGYGPVQPQSNTLVTVNWGGGGKA